MEAELKKNASKHDADMKELDPERHRVSEMEMKIRENEILMQEERLKLEKERKELEKERTELLSKQNDYQENLANLREIQKNVPYNSSSSERVEKSEIFHAPKKNKMRRDENKNKERRKTEGEKSNRSNITADSLPTSGQKMHINLI